MVGDSWLATSNCAARESANQSRDLQKTHPLLYVVDHSHNPLHLGHEHIVVVAYVPTIKKNVSSIS